MSLYKYLYYTFCNIILTLGISIWLQEAPVPFVVLVAVFSSVVVYVITEIAVGFSNSL